MNDDFINSLASDLKPVAPLSTGRLWGLALAIVAIMTTIVVLFYQIRPELASNLWGNVLKSPMVVLKPAYFLVLGGLSLLAIKGLARPEGHISGRTLAALVALIALLVVDVTATMMTAASGEFAHQMSMTYGLCVSTIIGGGLTAFGALWGLWLRHTATQWPRVLGGISALACAGLVAAAYALHCAMDSPIYIAVFYALPVAVVAGIGAALGPRLLRW